MCDYVLGQVKLGVQPWCNASNQLREAGYSVPYEQTMTLQRQEQCKQGSYGAAICRAVYAQDTGKWQGAHGPEQATWVLLEPSQCIVGR